MKGFSVSDKFPGLLFVLATFCSYTLAAENAAFSLWCSSKHGVFMSHPFSCIKFLRCSHGRAYVFQCPANLRWNQILQSCDYPQHTICMFNESDEAEESKENFNEFKPKTVKRDISQKKSVEKSYKNCAPTAKANNDNDPANLIEDADQKNTVMSSTATENISSTTTSNDKRSSEALPTESTVVPKEHKEDGRNKKEIVMENLNTPKSSIVPVPTITLIQPLTETTNSDVKDVVTAMLTEIVTNEFPVNFTEVIDPTTTNTDFAENMHSQSIVTLTEFFELTASTTEIFSTFNTNSFEEKNATGYTDVTDLLPSINSVEDTTNLSEKFSNFESTSSDILSSETSPSLTEVSDLKESTIGAIDQTFPTTTETTYLTDTTEPATLMVDVNIENTKSSVKLTETTNLSPELLSTIKYSENFDENTEATTLFSEWLTTTIFETTLEHTSSEKLATEISVTTSEISDLTELTSDIKTTENNFIDIHLPGESTTESTLHLTDITSPELLTTTKYFQTNNENTEATTLFSEWLTTTVFETTLENTFSEKLTTEITVTSTEIIDITESTTDIKTAENNNFIGTHFPEESTTESTLHLTDATDITTLLTNLNIGENINTDETTNLSTETLTTINDFVNTESISSTETTELTDTTNNVKSHDETNSESTSIINTNSTEYITAVTENSAVNIVSDSNNISTITDLDHSNSLSTHSPNLTALLNIKQNSSATVNLTATHITTAGDNNTQDPNTDENIKADDSVNKSDTNFNTNSVTPLDVVSEIVTDMENRETPLDAISFISSVKDLDPRLPFRLPACQGIDNHHQFQAIKCSQYYQCFAGWAFLLNCHEGYAFEPESGNCIEDIDMKCNE